MAKKPDINATFDAEEENSYARLRMAVMTDEQQELADRIKDWYTDAYRDKDDRGIFDKMETADLYWEGEQHPPESDTDPASNTNIVNSTIEGQVGYLVEQNLSIEAKPRTPSDIAFRDKAVTLMEWCLEQNKMRRKLDVHERRRKKFGVGVWRVLFDPDLLDGMGMPDIQGVNPAYVFPDPVITDLYKINEGRFFIEAINRSIDSARDRFGDELADAIEPGYVPMEFSDIFDEMENTPGGNVSNCFYQHWLVWTRVWVDLPPEAPDMSMVTDDNPEPEQPEATGEKKKMLRLIEMSACGVILRDTLADDTTICEDDQRYPYFFTPDMMREGTVWAKSTAELLIPVQDKIDDMDDQIRINGRLTGNPQRVVDVNSGIDPDKLSNDGGDVIPSNYEGGMKYLEPPEMPQYIINHRNQALMVERTIVSRWSDQMNGIKQEGVGTATESLGLQQGGTQSITHDKMLLEETLSEVFEYALALMLENYTEEEVFRVTKNGKDDFQSFNPSDMRNIPMLIKASQGRQQAMAEQFPQAENVPEWVPHPDGVTKRIALDIEVKVGAGLPSNKAFIFQMIQQAQASGAITPPEYRELFREYSGLPIPDQPPMPPMPPGGVPGMPGAPGAPMQSPLVDGLTSSGNPMMPVAPGGAGGAV